MTLTDELWNQTDENSSEGDKALYPRIEYFFCASAPQHFIEARGYDTVNHAASLHFYDGGTNMLTSNDRYQSGTAMRQKPSV